MTTPAEEIRPRSFWYWVGGGLIGLGVVVPPDSSLMMFLGALLFWVAARKYGSQPQSRGYAIWVDSQEPICAGLIAGAALIGIGDILVKVFVFG